MISKHQNKSEIYEECTKIDLDGRVQYSPDHSDTYCETYNCKAEQKTFLKNNSRIYLSNNGERLFVLNAQGVLLVFDPNSLKHIDTITEWDSDIVDFLISNDEHFILTICGKNIVKFYDFETFQKRKIIHIDSISKVFFAEHSWRFGIVFILLNEKDLSYIHDDSPENLKEISNSGNPKIRAAITKCQKYLIFNERINFVSIWSIVHEKVIYSIEWKEQIISDILLSRNSNIIFTSSVTGRITGWSLRTMKEEVSTKIGNQTHIKLCHFGQTEDLLAYDSHSKMRLFSSDLKDKNIILGFKNSLRQVIVSPFLKTIISYSTTHQLQVWQLPYLRSDLISNNVQLLANNQELAQISIGPQYRWKKVLLEPVRTKKKEFILLFKSKSGKKFFKVTMKIKFDFNIL
jgi:WD40 repeat protein